MKVGVDTLKSKKSGKRRLFTYMDVIYDADNWVDANKFLPADFDLVYMEIQDQKKLVPGWSNGENWDGANYRKNSKVLYWKTHDQKRKKRECLKNECI